VADRQTPGSGLPELPESSRLDSNPTVDSKFSRKVSKLAKSGLIEPIPSKEFG
jgi:hypothetical protein